MSEKIRMRIVDALGIYVDTAEIAKVRGITEGEAVDWYNKNKTELGMLLQMRCDELIQFWDIPEIY